ncbi:MAG: heavy metal translocating P-type ATPase [Candidatus Wenzhouxiangella sp. M2_3B_020]
MTTHSENPCFHCGEPVPPGTDLAVEIGGEPRPMCCAGCRAVATLIHSSGLDRYYDFRDALPERPDRADVEAGRYAAWDRDAVLDFHARGEGNGRRSIVLVLENVHCAACAWLIHRYLGQFAGVSETRLDVGDGRLRLRFEPGQTPLSTLAAALERVGYPPHLDTPDSGIDRDRNERRRMLRYLIVAALGMMQVMSYALANYIGGGSADASGGMDPETEHFFRLVSMLVAVPVALYAGQPFYRSAVNHLRQRHLGLDVPVAAAILLALFSSVLITLFGQGEVYFDSVVMFIFFLLLGRFAVMLARQQSGAVHSALARALPNQARRLTATGSEAVGLIELEVGDRVIVADGDVVPADGVVTAGDGSVDESLLSGESESRPRAAGDAVLAGSLVTGGSLQLRIEKLGSGTVLSGIVELLSEARRRRPRLARLADTAAAWFIGLILLSTGLAAIYWWQTDPAAVIPVVLAMLVVACPCALALGTPTALASATRGLALQGVLTANPDALEALPRITHVVLDKTGTLTEPGARLVEVRSGSGLEREEILALAGALERVSSHPIARAFGPFDCGRRVEQAENIAGAGVAGLIDGRRCWLGRADWVSGRAGRRWTEPGEGIWLALFVEGAEEPAWLRVDARLRDGAKALVERLKDSGISVVLASGDREINVASVAQTLGIEAFHAAMRPEHKLALVERLQRQGGRVAMVGDGINDAPVLAGADISIALAEGAAIARTQADLVATGRDLHPLTALFGQAPRVRRIIRQNLVWALTYNLGALPLAAAGLVPPWAAAIGMSASSIAVVLNARRLGRTARRKTPGLRRAPGPAAEAA